jgi:hypothetical protein
MASEVSRKQFGMTDKGQVVVIHKSGFTDDGRTVVDAFEVRHGVRTIGEYPSSFKAEAVAKALLG